ncbi:hypothetical protein LPJ66_011736, partial [Kickxella alabastrina]
AEAEAVAKRKAEAATMRRVEADAISNSEVTAAAIVRSKTEAAAAPAAKSRAEPVARSRTELAPRSRANLEPRGKVEPSPRTKAGPAPRTKAEPAPRSRAEVVFRRRVSDAAAAAGGEAQEGSRLGRGLATKGNGNISVSGADDRRSRKYELAGDANKGYASDSDGGHNPTLLKGESRADFEQSRKRPSSSVIFQIRIPKKSRVSDADVTPTGSSPKRRADEAGIAVDKEESASTQKAKLARKSAAPVNSRELRRPATAVEALPSPEPRPVSPATLPVQARSPPAREAERRLSRDDRSRAKSRLEREPRASRPSP